LKKILENGKTFHVHELEELIPRKWLSYLKQPTDSMQWPLIFQSFFAEIEKSILKFMWKNKRPQIAEESNPRSFTLLDFELYFRAIVPKTAWYRYTKINATE
jgi:hypothetical protein